MNGDHVVDGVTWCPWCAKNTGGDFCDVGCMRAFWNDVRGRRVSGSEVVCHTLTRHRRKAEETRPWRTRIPAMHADIVRRVARAHGLKPIDLAPGHRGRSVQRARVAAWQALREAGASYSECARATRHKAHQGVPRALKLRRAA
jgi:hypothetical protein